MKRLICAALFVCLAAGCLLPGAAEDCIYTASIVKECTLRKEAGSEYRIMALAKYTKVSVYEQGETWSRVRIGQEDGWVLTKCLGGYRSADPERYPVPGARIMQGAVTLEEDAWIVGGRFSGVTAKAGTVICADPAGAAYTLPVWRGEGGLPAACGAYIVFTPWREAQPGDAIAGFTTFYNEETGRPLAEERAFNIALCCARVDGAVTAPGETFSFNRLAGRYYRDGGYRLAVNVSKAGRGYGGGVCQVTTTLHNALLGLPVRIVQWELHNVRGTDYIPQFFDAAVGNIQDYAFVNTLPYPIRVRAADQDGCVTVLILRAEE